MKLGTVLLIILVILIAVLVFLYFYGKRMQDRQAEQMPAFEAAKQTISILTIDKKKMRLSESGLPQIAIDQAPFYTRWMKVPVVKAKVGPKIMTLMCDPNVFEQLPLKQECKVVISGIYIAELKSARGGIKPVPKKRSLMDKILGRTKKKRERSLRNAEAVFIMHQEVPHVSGCHHCAGGLHRVPRRRGCDPGFMEHEAASDWDTMKLTEQSCTRYVRPSGILPRADLHTDAAVGEMFLRDVHGVIHGDADIPVALSDGDIVCGDPDHKISERGAVAARSPLGAVVESHMDIGEPAFDDLHGTAADQDHVLRDVFPALPGLVIAYDMRAALPGVGTRSHELHIFIIRSHQPVSADRHKNVSGHQYSSISIFCVLSTCPGRMELAKSRKLSARSLT